MLTAEQKLAKIEDHLRLGRTVVISTALRAIEVNKRTVARFIKAGHKLFRAEGNSLFIARGKAWACIDCCTIRIYE